MQGILQYCATEDGTYKDVGTLRSRKRKSFKIDNLSDLSRESEREPIGYRVRVVELALALNTDFLDSTQWYFRMYFPDDAKMIQLGQHHFLLHYDGLVTINEIEYHQVELDFTIGGDEYNSYSDPVDPDDIILEDDAIYIE